MGRKWLGLFAVFCSLCLLAPLSWSIADDALDEDCSQERYVDFQRRQREKEQSEIRRESGAKLAREARIARKKELTEARKTYKRTKVGENPRLEIEWNEQQRAAREIQEANRKRYVQNRDNRERTRCSGPKIPELQEFDLQDY